jgi:hypothetical protein
VEAYSSDSDIEYIGQKSSSSKVNYQSDSDVEIIDGPPVIKSSHSTQQKSTPSHPISHPNPSLDPPLPSEPEILLSPEQRAVLDKVKAGGNVFFTGSAGDFFP